MVNHSQFIVCYACVLQILSSEKTHFLILVWRFVVLSISFLKLKEQFLFLQLNDLFYSRSIFVKITVYTFYYMYGN